MKAGEALEVRGNAEKAERELRKQSNSPKIKFWGCSAVAEYFRTAAVCPGCQHLIQTAAARKYSACSFVILSKVDSKYRRIAEKE